jgi:hypothetical protein
MHGGPGQRGRNIFIVPLVYYQALQSAVFAPRGDFFGAAPLEGSTGHEDARISDVALRREFLKNRCQETAYCARRAFSCLDM